jgi:glutathione S-transferase
MQLLANTTSPYVRIARVSMIEKGLNVEPTIVDPWADDPRLRKANAATRVPTLITDDGVPLTESLLIVQWLEHLRPAPDWPSLLGSNMSSVPGVLSRAGIALGVIDAAVHTIIIRKVTAPVLFDDTPVGLRRRRTMAEGMARLESAAAQGQLTGNGNGNGNDACTPTLDAICAVVALDYLRFRFDGQPWLPDMPALDTLSASLGQRTSFAQTLPR